jgi:hypothetical protein
MHTIEKGAQTIAWQIEKGARTKLPTWLKRARPKLPDRLKWMNAQSCLLDLKGRTQSCLTDWKGRTHKMGHKLCVRNIPNSFKMRARKE